MDSETWTVQWVDTDPTDVSSRRRERAVRLYGRYEIQGDAGRGYFYVASQTSETVQAAK
jgi:hypothetical protein